VDVPHGLGAQPLGLVPGLQPACPSLLQQLLVELLQFQRSEFFQGDLANVGFDVVVDVAPVGLVGGWPYFYLGVVLKPHLHPLPHRVPANLGRVQSFRFLDCLFQLGLGLCLGFSQDVLVDGPAGLWIVSGSVPAFPSAIFSFSDVAAPLVHFFAMALLPFMTYQCLASLGYSHAWSLWALINNTTYHRKRKSQSLRPQLSEGLDFPGDPHAQRKPGNEGCQGGLLP